MPPPDHDYDLFLSHASEDNEWCEGLALRLQDAGVKVWFDGWELQAGDDIGDRINDGIKRSRQTAAVWTSSYFEKEWTNAEQWSRKHADVLGRDRLLLPIWREDCDVPPLLAGLLRVDFRNDERFEDAFSELLRALSVSRGRHVAQTRARSAPPTAKRRGGHGELANVFGPLLDPVLLVLTVVFIGMLVFGLYLVSKEQHILGASCVVPSCFLSLAFLYAYGLRWSRGAPSSSMEFALYRNAVQIVEAHERSAEELVSRSQ